jgi:hypothetical protein
VARVTAPQGRRHPSCHLDRLLCSGPHRELTQLLLVLPHAPLVEAGVPQGAHVDGHFPRQERVADFLGQKLHKTADFLGHCPRFRERMLVQVLVLIRGQESVACRHSDLLRLLGAPVAAQVWCGRAGNMLACHPRNSQVQNLGLCRGRSTSRSCSGCTTRQLPVSCVPRGECCSVTFAFCSCEYVLVATKWSLWPSEI